MINHAEAPDDFCRLPAIKVFLLAIATFGFYLVYWYEAQYSKSKKIKRSVFKDFLKSYFFILCSYHLLDKINILLGRKGYFSRLNYRIFLIVKFAILLILEAIFYRLYSIHVFFLAALILEASYAFMLQSLINERLPSKECSPYPWQRFEWFHTVVLVGGLTFILFFQIAEDPIGIIMRGKF